MASIEIDERINREMTIGLSNGEVQQEMEVMIKTVKKTRMMVKMKKIMMTIQIGTKKLKNQNGSGRDTVG